MNAEEAPGGSAEGDAPLKLLCSVGSGFQIKPCFCLNPG